MEGIAHDRRRLGAESHALSCVEGFRFAPSNGGIAAAHGPHEVLDHPVGVGVVGVKPVEFSIGREVDSGLALGVEDHACSVDDGLLGGEGVEPLRNRIGSYGGGQDVRFGGKGRNGIHDRC